MAIQQRDVTVQAVGVIPQFTICDRLRKAREVVELDQGPFAQEIGVSRGTVSTYERDVKAAFKPVVLRAWAMRTGVPLEWLLNGAMPGDPVESPGTEVLPRLDSNQQPSGYASESNVIPLFQQREVLPRTARLLQVVS